MNKQTFFLIDSHVTIPKKEKRKTTGLQQKKPIFNY